jgi:hypothetical protein
MELRCNIASKKLQAMAYVTERSADAVIALSRARRVHTVLRPVTPDAPSLSGEGYIGKPMYVKWKSCSAEDQFIGAPLGCFGMVLLYRPTAPPADEAAFEKRRVTLVAELDKLARDAKTPPLKRQSLAKLISAVRATTLAKVVDRQQTRSDEAHALDGKESAFEVNVYLDKVYRDYMKTNAVPSAGVPMLAFAPRYESFAAYIDALTGGLPADMPRSGEDMAKYWKGFGKIGHGTGQKGDAWPMYLVAVSPRAQGQVFAYIGDLDLFDAHLQLPIEADRGLLPEDDRVPWRRSVMLDADSRVQFPTEIVNSIFPFFLNDLGADVYHGAHMFWVNWFFPDKPDLTKSLLGTYLDILQSHRQGTADKPGTPLLMVTPACNVCPVFGPSESQVAALDKQIREMGGSGPKAEALREKVELLSGSDKMNWRYDCHGAPTFPAPQGVGTDEAGCSALGGGCTTNTDCCDPEGMRCVRPAPDAGLECVAADFCIAEDRPCSSDADAAPCCMVNGSRMGCADPDDGKGRRCLP